ncbi:YczE/YyaS/YitT family protein [Serpentinicella alkaliphila]|uniref:Putative membrane protein YczE n=1 Tax=Serpentinicella alkaliphila TaxID=1734049 RepID=A0A4R2THI3_9FIRM|nr:hypothetical protein [Serpentinicella alkaliphila]QUH24693.1 hypothetical protein HZR23_02050 [Serpentinicella alkaliphila]TCQ03040.1 putative membrane protein YczE [Serpentinicella alkaliphila]
MKKAFVLLCRLFFGLFLVALGVVITIKANLGLAPWDVFHQGISKITNITIGQASITVGLILVLINFLLGERIGWATICNMIFVGVFIDLLMISDLIPTFDSLLLRLGMMILGMFVFGFASYFYIGTGLGSGPRDGLMIYLTKKTNKSVRFVRNTMEISVSILGFILGGTIGIGTIITAVGIGYFVQLAFKMMKFDVNELKHRFIDDDIVLLKNLLIKPKEQKM